MQFNRIIVWQNGEKSINSNGNHHALVHLSNLLMEEQKINLNVGRRVGENQQNEILSKEIKLKKKLMQPKTIISSDYWQKTMNKFSISKLNFNP